MGLKLTGDELFSEQHSHCTVLQDKESHRSAISVVREKGDVIDDVMSKITITSVTSLIISTLWGLIFIGRLEAPQVVVVVACVNPWNIL